MDRQPMHAGRGCFVFNDRAAGIRQSIRVFYFLPRLKSPTLPIVIALHGFDRAASEFRDCLLKPAEALQFALLVPEFDNETFPGVHAYNYGNVKSPAPDNMVLPRAQWTFSLIDRLFDHVRGEIASNSEVFHLFGNSAGAQYVLRYLALTEKNSVGRAVAANSGWYMLPDLDIDYPDGMGGIGLDAGFLRRYLSARLRILLGDADTDPEAADLPRNEAAVAQGPHRLARGLWHFEHCRMLAERLGISFGWRLEILPGAGHLDQTIFDVGAMRLLVPDDPN